MAEEVARINNEAGSAERLWRPPARFQIPTAPQRQATKLLSLDRKNTEPGARISKSIPNTMNRSKTAEELMGEHDSSHFIKGVDMFCHSWHMHYTEANRGHRNEPAAQITASEY